MRLVDRFPTLPNALVQRRGRHLVVVGGGRGGAAAARLGLAEGMRVTVVDDADVATLTAGLARHGLSKAHVAAPEFDANAGPDADADGTSTEGVSDVAASLSLDLHLVGGGITAATLLSADVIVLSPGVPRVHPAVAEAIHVRPVVNELELALAVLSERGEGLNGLRIQGITGTNGKSTTTTIAGNIARVVDPHAFVGGNLGEPLCAAVVDGLTPGSASAPRHIVVELSSYQLETLRFFPVHGAAVTNLAPDHLDRYPHVEAYYAAKARLLSLVEVGGGVSLNQNDALSHIHLARPLPGGVMFRHFDISAPYEAKPHSAGEVSLPRAGDGVVIDAAGSALLLIVDDVDVRLPISNPRLVGHHNWQNAAAAVALASLVGIDVDAMVAGINGWPGIAHRLERLGDVKGVTWWNDSKATNVDATTTALRSFSAGVHLILGGVGKGSSYAPVVDLAKGRVVAVYTIGADAPAIALAFADADVDVHNVGSLEVACETIMGVAVDGEHLLLAPACASFDQFRDYIARGERLRDLYAARVGVDAGVNS